MDNATETVISRVMQTAATISSAVLQHLSRSVPGTGSAILLAPLFKAGKPPTKYASVTDSAAAEVVEFKEVVVTGRHTHKLIVKVTTPKSQLRQLSDAKAAAAAAAAASSSTAGGLFDKPEVEDAESSLLRAESASAPPAPQIDIRIDWTHPLSSVISVDPLFDDASSGANSTADAGAAAHSNSAPPAAVFTVVFLCAAKDAKVESPDQNEPRGSSGNSSNKAPPSKSDEALAKLMKKRSAFDWTLLALAHSSELALTPLETEHVGRLFRLGKPSLRARPYLVPDGLGGAALRDEWVSVYRAAIQNFWQERLESSVMPAPEVFQWCCWAQFAGATVSSSAAAPDLPGSAFCVVALSTKKLYVVSMVEGMLLSADPAARIPATAARSVDVASITAVDGRMAPFAVQVDSAKRGFAHLRFLSRQHAAEFTLECQRVFEMVCGPDAPFPVQMPA